MTAPHLPPVLIVGLGLIGGSAALALRAAGAKVRGVSRNPQTVAAALERGVIERGSASLEDEAGDAGVILLAAPVRASIGVLERLAGLAAPGTVITDACSTKREVAAAMNQLPDHLGAAGGHPMAGSERSGLDAADAVLFRGSTWVLTETARTDGRARDVCEALAIAAGASPLWADAAEHDRAVALVSHLPLLTAAALVRTAERADSSLAWQLAAGGFRDSTRLAAGAPEMSADILLTNSGEIRQAAAELSAAVDELLDAADGRPEELLRMLGRAAERRRSMYGEEQ